MIGIAYRSCDSDDFAAAIGFGCGNGGRHLRAILVRQPNYHEPEAPPPPNEPPPPEKPPKPPPPPQPLPPPQEPPPPQPLPREPRPSALRPHRTTQGLRPPPRRR